MVSSTERKDRTLGVSDFSPADRTLGVRCRTPERQPMRAHGPFAAVWERNSGLRERERHGGGPWVSEVPFVDILSPGDMGDGDALFNSLICKVVPLRKRRQKGHPQKNAETTSLHFSRPLINVDRGGNSWAQKLKAKANPTWHGKLKPPLDLTTSMN